MIGFNHAANKKGVNPASGINPFVFLVPRPRIELGTRGFSVRCSTD
jgi:hypothetical protein